MPHVVCLRPVHPEALALLRDHPGITVEVMENPTPEKLAPVLPYTEAVIVRATRIDQAFLDMAPELRIVARHGVGYDAVDVPALTARGIPLTVTPDANAVSVAEHAMALLLSVARRVKEYDAATRALDWGPRELAAHLRPRRPHAPGGGLRPHRRPHRAPCRRLRDARARL